MRALSFAITMLFLFQSNAMAAPEDDVRAAGQEWVQGISRGDADYMVGLYAEDAILHGTVSADLRQGPTLIREYFAATEANPPTMNFVEPQNIRVFGDVAINTGFYETRFGTNPPLRLRYSFVYHRIDNRWLIVDHHSSRLPQ